MPEQRLAHGIIAFLIVFDVVVIAVSVHLAGSWTEYFHVITFGLLR